MISQLYLMAVSVVLTGVSAEEWLQALDPVAVGHTRRVDLGNGLFQEVRTVAVRPPIFLIPGFLNDTQIDAMVDEARPQWQQQMSGMGSVAHVLSAGYVANQDAQKVAGTSEFKRAFTSVDRNMDGFLNSKELARLFHKVLAIPNHDHQAFFAYHNLSFSKLQRPSHISIQELISNKVDLVGYAKWFAHEYPYMMQRFSQQAWLRYGQSRATEVLLERAERLTGLPKSVVRGENSLQVVRYPQKGHYSCHYDSPPSHVPNGDVVRPATMSIFLNEALKGGEIAFPGADVPDSENWNTTRWGRLKGQCEVTSACTTSGGLVLKPKRGDAVFWYNMKIDQWGAGVNGKRPGKEAFIWNSLHCGAEVVEGEKLLANMWLRFPKVATKPPESMFSEKEGSAKGAPSFLERPEAQEMIVEI